jgi:ankyrin repeat protein
MPIDNDWFERERLHRAAADGDMPEVARLIANGFAINSFDDLSMTPLHYAVKGEHYKVALWLLEHGALVNANDEERIGETPLCVAAQGDYPEMVQLLLRHGADPDINGWMALTARLRAQRRKDEEGREISAIIESLRPPKLSPGGRR